MFGAPEKPLPAFLSDLLNGGVIIDSSFPLKLMYEFFPFLKSYQPRLSGTPLAPLLREGLKFVISHLCFIHCLFWNPWEVIYFSPPVLWPPTFAPSLMLQLTGKLLVTALAYICFLCCFFFCFFF